MSLVALFKGKGPSGFGYASTAEQVTDGIDLTGKTFLLTGCNSGIGLETLRVLALRGAHVVAAARTRDKAQAALAKAAAEKQGTPLACELSEPAAVRECVEAVKKLDKPLDGMVCNAGIMALPKQTTKHGYELQFLTNHIGHFILVTGLLELMTEKGRVVMVSSAAHKSAPSEGIEFDNLDGARGYTPWKNYGQSKLANILFANQLGKKFAGTARVANSIHPGVIRTNLARHMNPIAKGALAIANPLFLKTTAQGAATQCYVATHSKVESVSGEYFADCNESRASKHGRDESMAEKLWDVSEEIVAKLK